MSFIHPALASAFLLVTVPLLIHWINLMRHQRVEWAAMKFLQESFRRHRNWIRFKQLILLLMRMASMALIVAMLAQLVTPDQWSRLFGDRVTHHLILLDDSYSMADRGGDSRVYDRALRVVRNIGGLAAAQPGRQIVTLLTFSEAAQVAKNYQPETPSKGSDEDETSDSSSSSVPLRAHQKEFTLVSDFEVWLEQIRPELEISELSSGPDAALEAVTELLTQTEVANRVVYVVSDFRTKQWNQSAELLETLDALQEDGVELCFVRCVRRERSNLTLSDLHLEYGTNAAGVPLTAMAHVTNHGPDTLSNVQLGMNTIYFDPGQEQNVEPSDMTPPIEPLVVEPIGQIAPGETAVRGVQVYFPKPGYHVIEASLPDDALATDNRRFCAVDLPAGVPVLIIDGDPQRISSMLMGAVFEPSSRARTGVFPEVRDVTYFRNTTADDLKKFYAVYLLNVPQLDERTVRMLEKYVDGGGGLCFFLGPDIQLPFYKDLYAEGSGLFPVPLEREDLLAPDESQATPDFAVENHPIFRIFFGNRNPFVGDVSVQHYFRTAENWLAGHQVKVQVLARLRNGQPLCVEQRYGQGRVVAFLTTLTPEWNNWARNPSFVVVLLDLQSYLVSARQPLSHRRVGGPIDVRLEKSKFRSDLSFVIPDGSTQTRRTIDLQAHPDRENADVLLASLGRSGTLEKRDRLTEKSGVYEVWTLTREGDAQVTRHALNVDPEEGDLRVIEPVALVDQLGTLNVQIRWWEEFDVENPRHAGYNWHSPLLAGLVLLLLIEQAMAYAASYHVADRTRPKESGGSRMADG